MSCVYCDQALMLGGAGSALSAEDVRVALRSAAGRAGPAPEIGFYGGTFTGLAPELQEELLTAAAAAVRRGEAASVRVSTHPAWCGDEALARLARFGVATVEVGVQSLDERVLRASRRGVLAGEIEAALARVVAHGFRLGVQTMVGLPGSDRASDLATATRLADSGARLARIYPTLVLRETALALMTVRGEYRPLALEEAVARAADQVARFEARGVTVQRIGLHVDQALRRAVVAGPLDESLGERVRGELAFRRLTRLVQERSGDELTVRVAPRERSRYVGYRRENLKRIGSMFPGVKLRIIEG